MTPIAIQLFAVRGEVAKSLPETLKNVAKIGYQGAEPWGYDGKTLAWQGHSALDIRKMYDANGLACCGIHLATNALRGDELKRTIEFNGILGNRCLIIAADKQRMESVAGIAELACILNQAAEVAKASGMFVGYHAHGFDFITAGGRISWEILFSSVSPDVIMQMDIGNCMSGGGDPIAMLRKFPGRARSVHLKDFGGPVDSVIGEGKVDWATAIEVCKTLHKPEWYVIEQGETEGLGYDIPARSLTAVKKMLGC